MEQLKDLMVLEQLLNTLPKEVRVWVSEHKPKTSAKAARLANDYILAHKPVINDGGYLESVLLANHIQRCDKDGEAMFCLSEDSPSKTYQSSPATTTHYVRAI